MSRTWHALQAATASAFLIWLGIVVTGSVGPAIGLTGALAFLGLWAYVCHLERTRRVGLASIADGGYRICPECSYPLAGDAGICPECGSAYTPASLRTTWRRAGAPARPQTAHVPSEAPRRPRRRYGCLLSAAAALGLAAVFWSMGGVYGLLHLSAGRNPWRYVAPTPERRAQTIENAEQIIAALERWNTRHGSYPRSLDELTPSELPTHPPSATGDRRWNYSRPRPDRFVLDFFEGRIYEHTWWDSDIGGWRVDH